MKLKVLKEYLNECLETINRVKGTDLKIVKQDLCHTSNNKINAVDFTLVFEGSLFIKLHLSLWVNVRDEDKTEYQKALIENIWDQVLSVRRKNIQDKLIQGSGISKITLGLGDYTIRPEPIYIDPNAAYAQVDTDLTGYTIQQVLKQHKDDLVNQRLSNLDDIFEL